LFGKRVGERVKVLVIEDLLTPGRRAVAAALRVMGLAQNPRNGNDHRVLNRARWASLARCPILLALLLDAFVAPEAPVVVGLDGHIERRRGAKIAAQGIYRDPARSSKGVFVHDFTTREWVGADRAWFVVSPTIDTPMASGIAAFATEEGGRAEQGAVGGRIARWDDLLKGDASPKGAQP
jgi:hypothetical protein